MVLHPHYMIARGNGHAPADIAAQATSYVHAHATHGKHHLPFTARSKDDGEPQIVYSVPLGSGGRVCAGSALIKDISIVDNYLHPDNDPTWPTRQPAALCGADLSTSICSEIRY